MRHSKIRGLYWYTIAITLIWNFNGFNNIKSTVTLYQSCRVKPHPPKVIWREIKIIIKKKVREWRVCIQKSVSSNSTKNTFIPINPTTLLWLSILIPSTPPTPFLLPHLPINFSLSLFLNTIFQFYTFPQNSLFLL